jgi:TonB family protein
LKLGNLAIRRSVTFIDVSMSQPAQFDTDRLELNLLPLEADPPSLRRIAALGVASIAVHLILGTLVSLLPADPIHREAPQLSVDIRKAVKVVAPRFQEPTQKAPNIGKVSRELDVRSAVQASEPQAPRFRPPALSPAPRDLPPAPVIEGPRVEVAASTQIPVVPSSLPQAPPPEKPADKQKIVFEKVGSGPNPSSNLKLDLPQPATTAAELARAVSRPPTGGLTVGDTGDDISVAGAASSDGRPKSNLQLLSDPEGVDFKPYLVQVLSAVRHNWLSVIPESARLGRRGNVLIQFSIDRRGGVPKLVIASASGTDALDRAAVAGVSMSNPFPPLPNDYKGDQIRLQLSFSYNVRR